MSKTTPSKSKAGLSSKPNPAPNLTPNQPQGIKIGYRGLYDSKNPEPFRISRSKIELFINCPRCFWLEAIRGIKQPPGFPFNINSAVDNLFKNEFDTHRQNQTQHPIQIEYKLSGILPLQHEHLDIWRESFTGVQYLHSPTNLLVFGGVDDLWWDAKSNQIIIVDYKATAKKDDITSLDADWHAGYKRQLEIYAWMLQSLGLPVSKTGYWVYANGIADLPAFNNEVKFRVTLIPHSINNEWVGDTLIKIKDTLESSKVPPMGINCDFCKYAGERLKFAWSMK